MSTCIDLICQVIYLLSVHPPPPLFLLGGWVSYQIVKKGDLTGSQFLEGGCWKIFEQGGGGWGEHSFYIKNKLKSEILNEKKTKNQNAYLP